MILEKRGKNNVDLLKARVNNWCIFDDKNNRTFSRSKERPACLLHCLHKGVQWSKRRWHDKIQIMASHSYRHDTWRLWWMWIWNVCWHLKWASPKKKKMRATEFLHIKFHTPLYTPKILHIVTTTDRKMARTIRSTIIIFGTEFSRLYFSISCIGSRSFHICFL